MLSEKDFCWPLFDASPDCILILDEAGRVLIVNETCRQLIETTGAPQAVGKVWIERWPLEEQGKVAEALQAAKTGSTGRFQAFGLSTGAERWWDVCVTAARAQTDDPIRLLCICRDVTEMRRAEKALKESEAWLQFGCSVAGLALSRIDYKENVAHFSAEAARQLGLGDGPMTVSLSDIHPDDRARLLDAANRALDPAGSGRLDLDFRILRPSGETRWHRARQQVVFEGEGDERRASHAMLAVYDVSKEKAAEEALRRHQAFLQDVLDSLPHQVVVIGADGKIVAVNKPWERFALLNGGALDCVGPGVDYLATAQTAAAEGDAYARQAFDGIRAVLSGESDRFVMEYPCHAPGRKQWFVLHTTWLSRTPATIIISHTDITERKLTEAKRREAEARLTASETWLQLGCALAGLALSEIDFKHNVLHATADAVGQLGLGDAPRTIPLDDVFPLFHPDDLERIKGELARVVDPSGSGRAEAVYRIIRPSGELRWHRGRMQVVFEGEGDERRASHALLAVYDVTTEKVAEEALRKKEALLQLGCSLAGLSLSELDFKRDILHLSADGARQLGLGDAPMAVPHEDVLRMFHPDDLPRIRDELARVADPAGSGRVEAVYRIIRPSGEIRWYRGRMQAVFEGEGAERRASHATLAAYDITTEKGAEEELRRNQTWLQLGCALAGLALSEMDFKRNVLRLSAEAAEQLGLGDAPMTVPLDDVLRMFHPDDFERMSKNFACIAHPAGPGHAAADYRFIRPSGELRWHRSRLKVIFEGEGAERHASHAILALYDITVEKAAEENLRKNEAFLNAVLDSLPHHVAVIGTDGKIVAVNEPWERYTRENGGTPASVGPGVDYLASARAAAEAGDYHARQTYEGVTALLKGEIEGFVLEYPCHAPDREQWFMLHATRLSNPPAAVILSHTDITSRKRNEDKRREAEERLRESDRNKDEFIATLAHELRNPLAPLRSGLQFFRRAKPGDPGIGRMQDIMERQVTHLVRLVDDLLDISRISRGKLELKKEEIDVAAVMRQAIADIRARAEAKNLALHVSGLDETLPMMGDPVRVAQIFINLLDNAVKYTEADGAISVAMERCGPEFNIAVGDTGMGISPEILPQIFDLFAQGDRPLSKGRAGLGVGLALVRKLVELHGGLVEASSEGEGRGARFLVRLPASSAASRVTTPDKDAPTLAETGRRALLIDDNPDVADSLALALARFGFEVDVAYSGAEGLARIPAFKPSLVLLDLGMPVMDGYETARALRALPGGAEIKLVALTGWGEAETRRRVKEAGFDAHLVKPAGVEDIAALVGKRPDEAAPSPPSVC